MIEILVFIYLAKRIGDLAQSRGYSKGKYQSLLLLLWILGEVSGISFSSNLLGSKGILLIYVLGIAGAAAGAWCAFFITRKLGEESMSKIWTLVLVFLLVEGVPLLISIMFRLLDLSVSDIVLRSIDFLITAACGLILSRKLSQTRPPWVWVAGMAGLWIVVFAISYLLDQMHVPVLYANIIYWIAYILVASLIIGYLASKEPRFQANTPLLWTLIIGAVGGVLIYFLNSWFSHTFVSSRHTFTPYAISIQLQSINRGILEGLIVGICLEWPEFLKEQPAAVPEPTSEPHSPDEMTG